MDFLILVMNIYLIIGTVLAVFVIITGVVFEIRQGYLKEWCKNKIKDGGNKWLITLAVVLDVCLIFVAIVIYWLLYMIDGVNGRGLLGNER